jgi:hypothetical protein
MDRGFDRLDQAGLRACVNSLIPPERIVKELNDVDILFTALDNGAYQDGRFVDLTKLGAVWGPKFAALATALPLVSIESDLAEEALVAMYAARTVARNMHVADEHHEGGCLWRSFVRLVEALLFHVNPSVKVG